MARKRMIDPGFWEDPTIGTLTIPARLLFIGMISHADDDGRLEVEPRYLRRAVFGFDDVTINEVVELLAEIHGLCRSVHFYTVNGRSFASFRNWKRYQYIQKPQGSRLPSPPDDDDHGPRSDEDDTDNGTLSYQDDTDNGTLSDNRIEKNRIEVNRIEQQQQQNARANGDTPPIPAGDDGVVVVVVVDQETKDDGGTVARSFLHQHGIPETTIKDILTANGGTVPAECLAAWASVILAPPPGLHNPKGMMIKRLKFGDHTVPEPARAERQFDPETGIRLPEPSTFTEEQRQARDAILREIDAKNPVLPDAVGLTTMAGRILELSPLKAMDPAKLLKFKGSS